ncbi:unnamed protein product [Caenorhabditis auriculariae]|uniref:Neurotransmitter-gated ion-channel ligand-binding domain-containing protein n=1 Tax=Caenorhabditis auriculariae TaxID=2777116 RepID=A0A8S1HUY0_9PELO|nr:unnamed protein product [Caenorhabditis auriculariae]
MSRMKLSIHPTESNSEKSPTNNELESPLQFIHLNRNHSINQSKFEGAVREIGEKKRGEAAAAAVQQLCTLRRLSSVLLRQLDLYDNSLLLSAPQSFPVPSEYKNSTTSSFLRHTSSGTTTPSDGLKSNVDDGPLIDTSLLSSVLDRLTNKTIYDKRLRPRYGDKPVDVGITIHVSSISAVSEVDMDFTLDFYMRQTWQDPRLAFGSLDLGLSKEITSLTVGVDYLDKLWKPDTFFPNEKKSFFHVATTHNSFLRIDSDGTVFTSQRLTVTATCPMKLQLFPMDSQRCKLEIESYGYSVLDINYRFGTDDAVSKSDFELPQFVLQDVKISNKTEKLSSGEYSRLLCYFMFKRSIGFYIIQIYLPSILIVVISWVSFWLSRDATPARVALGVTTVLTMTTLMTTTNSSMPKVSYVKSIDIFLGTDGRTWNGSGAPTQNGLRKSGKQSDER